MKNPYNKTKIACFGGYTVQAVINNFLTIFFVLFRKEYGLSYEALGRLIFINFAVQFFADMSSPFFVRKIGYKKSAVFSHILASAGLLFFAVSDKVISNSYLRIVVSIVIYAFGSGMIEVVISPIMELLPTKNKSGNMAVLHSFYCWGQAFTIIVTTLLLKLLGEANWKYIPALWSIIPLFNMVYFCFVPVVESKEQEGKDEKRTVSKTKLVCLLVIMTCSGASEIAMSQWASYFAQKGLNISKVAGDILGPCAFAVFMGTGRILYALFSKRVPFYKAISVLSVSCALCYFTVGVCTNPIISLTACSLCGITVSMFWPGTLSHAVKLFGENNPVLFGAIALFGDIGCALGPWLLGAVADLGGMKWGYIACLVFPTVMFIANMALKEKN